jgi:molybdopterin-guanine dinucleotide biosynthesis protein A
MSEARFTAVALAGGELEKDFRHAGYDAPNKAYLQVGGELMLVRVLRALRGSPAVGEIRLVTQTSAARREPDVMQLCDAVIEQGPDLIASVLAGFAGLPADERAMIVATDMPLLTSPAVDRFAALGAQMPCDVGYGFVERKLHDRAYPQVRHTWVRLREGTFCGAGMSLIRAGKTGQLETVLRDFTAARKSPAKLASLFSPALVLKVLTGQLGVAELERRASELTGVVCRGIMCPDAEVAVNVDRVEDLRTIESIVARSEMHRGLGA